MVAQTTARRRSRARPVPWLILIVLAGGAIWASARGPGGGAALDPYSTGPKGAKALDLLVGGLGGRVDTSGALPQAGHGVALILADHLTAKARYSVSSWVRSGGTLVIADPGSDLAGVARAEGSSPNSAVGAGGLLSPGCAAPWVADVVAIDPGRAPLLAEPPGATRACFGADGAFFALERTVGLGTVISLAGPDLWTNGRLGAAANSVLAADLLVPEPGSALAWLTGQVVGGGHQSLTQLLPARVDEMLIGIVLAFVVACLWLARRLGRPVSEEVPVVVPGSELVGAVSRLLARNGQWAHAAALLRSELRNDLASTMALTPAMSPEMVADMVATRTGRTMTSIRDVLDGATPCSDAELLSLARAVEEIRREVRGVRI